MCESVAQELDRLSPLRRTSISIIFSSLRLTSITESWSFCLLYITHHSRARQHIIVDCITIKAIHKHERRNEEAAARRKEKNQILMDKQSPMFAVNNNFVCLLVGDKWWRLRECAKRGEIAGKWRFGEKLFLNHAMLLHSIELWLISRVSIDYGYIWVIRRIWIWWMGVHKHNIPIAHIARSHWTLGSCDENFIEFGKR